MFSIEGREESLPSLSSRRPLGRICFIVFLLILIASLPLFPATFELGAMGGGGLCFASGSYFDSKAAQLAELGASSFAKPGSTQTQPFPGWSAGMYAAIHFLPWLSARLEPRLSFMGASRLALTDAGAAFDRYGASFYALLVPLLAQGNLRLGPGYLTVSAGGFYGLSLGNVMVTDRYSSTTTTALITQTLLQGSFLGASGGLGYSFKLGPGTASLGLRADWAFTSATAKTGAFGSEIVPLGVSLVASYGVPIGKGSDGRATVGRGAE